jgi:hypothetical protein
MDYRQRITIEPGKRGGKPCIRGLRITVYDVLEYLASGMSETEILNDFPDLTPGGYPLSQRLAVLHDARGERVQQAPARQRRARLVCCAVREAG